MGILEQFSFLHEVSRWDWALYRKWFSYVRCEDRFGSRVANIISITTGKREASFSERPVCAVRALYMNLKSVLFCLALSLGLLAQAQAPSLFQLVKPQALILVEPSPAGGDLVDVSMTDAQYPSDLLSKQIMTLCRSLASGPNGLTVYHSSVALPGGQATFLKARFGAFGLIDLDTGHIRMQEIVRAFAGAPPPYTLSGLSVTFDAARPVPSTLRRFDSDAVRLEGQYDPPPAEGLEYRVQLVSQKPEAIVIPDHFEPATTKPSDRATGQSQVASWALIATAVAASLALATLVYLRLLHKSAGPGKRR